MYQPIYNSDHKVWFVSIIDANGDCQGSVAHAESHNDAIRICNLLNGPLYRTKQINSQNVSENVFPPCETLQDAVNQLHSWAGNRKWAIYGDFDPDAPDAAYDALIVMDNGNPLQFAIERS